MNLDDWLRIALVFSGVIVICTFVIAVIRYPSKAYFWLVGLVFGGLLLIVPKLKNFDIDARTGKIHGEIVNIGDDATQVADIKLYISEVLKMVKSVEEKVANPSAVPATQLDVAKRKDLSVVIVYSSQQRELARRLESELLDKGFSANAVFSDFKELDAEDKGPSGTVRFVFRSEAVAESVKRAVKNLISGKILPDTIYDKISADAQIQLY